MIDLSWHEREEKQNIFFLNSFYEPNFFDKSYFHVWGSSVTQLAVIKGFWLKVVSDPELPTLQVSGGTNHVSLSP